MKISLKKTAIQLLQLVIIVAIITNLISYFKKPPIANESLPDIKVRFLDKKELSLSDFKTKPLVLYFWGSWCPVCKINSLAINSLTKDFNVVTVAVNSGGDDELKKYLKDHDLNFKVINDNDAKLAKKFAVTTFPTTFTYDSKGENIFVDSGYTSALSLRFKLWIGEFF